MDMVGPARAVAAAIIAQARATRQLKITEKFETPRPISGPA
jgi:hypothetical protein